MRRFHRACGAGREWGTLFFEMADESVHARYAARLTAYAMGICSDAELSCDIVQDVFCEYFKNPPRKDVASWFYRVCKNKLLNRLVRERRMSGCGEEFFDSVPCERPCPSHTAERNDSVSRLMEFLARLRPEEREALTLKYFEEFSYAQIAEIMNTTSSNVGTLIFRGMSKLKSMMSEDEKP